MATKRQFVLCLRNKGYEASLERRKIYQAISDKSAEADELLRVIDESGEDYLYPASYFVAISLPKALRQAIVAAA